MVSDSLYLLFSLVLTAFRGWGCALWGWFGAWVLRCVERDKVVVGESPHKGLRDKPLWYLGRDQELRVSWRLGCSPFSEEGFELCLSFIFNSWLENWLKIPFLCEGGDGWEGGHPVGLEPPQALSTCKQPGGSYCCQKPVTKGCVDGEGNGENSVSLSCDSGINTMCSGGCLRPYLPQRLWEMPSG